jgi:hypothetical protein
MLAALTALVPVSAGTGSTGSHAVYPNPFTAGTTFQLSLPKSSNIRIVVYDLLGKPVRVLYDGPHDAAENSPVPWDGNDETGRPVEPGIYICTLFAENVFVKGVKVVKVTT